MPKTGTFWTNLELVFFGSGLCFSLFQHTSYQDLQGKSLLTEWMWGYFETIILDTLEYRFLRRWELSQERGFAVAQEKHIVMRLRAYFTNIPSNKRANCLPVSTPIPQKILEQKCSKSQYCFQFFILGIWGRSKSAAKTGTQISLRLKRFINL